MKRTKNRYARQRLPRRRLKTPAPKDGWLLTELAAIAQLPLSSLRYYSHRDLIRPIELRGTATRYARRELLRLLALRRMKAEGKPSLDEIKRRLDDMDDTALEQWVTGAPISSAAAAALGISPSGSERAVFEPMTGVPVLNAGEGDRGTREPSLDAWSKREGPGRVETFYRVTLLPGLVLMVSSAASALVRSMARRIFEECGGSSAEQASAVA